MFKLSVLWSAPDVNPITRKARSIPIFNPFDKYGRVFFFSWFGFLVAFWSWYAFPPLLSDVIAKDIHMTKNQVANSNVIALTATLLVRLVAGPACDRFGPRKTFAACLLIGAIPTFLSGTAYNAGQLYALRFFIGILGGSFVPCQVWTTGFYDKNIVGTANSLTAGLGNAGGGITYFIMPAVFYSLERQGLSRHVAWRVSFIVPGIVIVVVALGLLFLCQDTPSGKWSDRAQAAENQLRAHTTDATIVNAPGLMASVDEKNATDSTRSNSPVAQEEKKLDQTRGVFGDHEVQMGEQQMLDVARGEVIQKPTFQDIFKTIATPQVLALGACYFCTFGAELSINSVLGTYYTNAIRPKISPLTAGNWAAMFGLLNAVFRPLGGVVSDLAYKYSGNNVWAKKILLHSYVAITGAFLLAIGFTRPKKLHELTLLIGIGLGFFLEGANGLNFSLVPHVWSAQNGVVSGFTGACGNLGGIVFAIVFRYTNGNTPKAIWIIGAIVMALNIATCWIRPVSKKQIGGR